MRLTGNRVIFALAATGLAAALIVFAWNVAGVSVEVGLAQRVAAARQEWARKSGGNYRAIVRVIDYNHPALGNITVVVKGGQMVQATSSAPGASALPVDEAANVTLEALFSYAQAQVADLPYWYVTSGNGYRYILRVNPELGYIEEFKSDFCGRGPLAAQDLECRYGFDVLDVKLGG